MEIELDKWTINTRETARITGIKESQLKNWMKRNGLFPNHRPGPGKGMAFVLSDLLALTVVKTLVSVGVDANFACRVASRHGFQNLWINGQPFQVGYKDRVSHFTFDPKEDPFLSVPLHTAGMGYVDNIIADIESKCGTVAAKDVEERYWASVNAAQARLRTAGVEAG